nr:alpha/beta fold hydrolase [uncultured Chloroflexus sp.]
MLHKVTLSDRATLAYLDTGNGLPVLLIHGFTDTARSYMELLIDELRHDHRVIAPDLCGGVSRPPNRAFPLDFYRRDAADMAKLLATIQPGPVVAIGFSDGAESALVLAARYPNLLRGVVAWGVSGVIS